MKRRGFRVLFASTAGPRSGFGHLMRCGVLARALETRREIALHASPAAVEIALAQGWTVHQGPAGTLMAARPDLLVVDDSSPARAQAWVRCAERERIPVALLQDAEPAGAAVVTGADLLIAGALSAVPAVERARVAGPSFLILDARIPGLRVAAPRRQRNHVLIALGGGVHVQSRGVAIARELARLLPGVTIDIAAGFSAPTELARLPDGCRWMTAPRGLAPYLARAAVAICAGGITLAEALALGTPTVALPVVEPQIPAIRAAARAGAAIDAGRPAGGDVRAAALAGFLLVHPAVAQAYGRRARCFVDGQGTSRVVARLSALLGSLAGEGGRHAA
jgi:spore coat polysaccharide biosynthesis predicted glycosyltransferase SpsG